MRLLLIEDEAKLAQQIKTHLEREAFAVDVAPDGASGLARARGNEYDCILLDLGLPGMPDGMTVCKALREVGSQVPILIVTARHALTARVSGLDAGDRVVVEIWVVLMPAMPDHTGGTVAANLIAAQKASVPPVAITVGTQTDSLGNLSKITALPAPQEQPPLGPLPPQPPALPGATVNLIDRTWGVKPRISVRND